MKSSTETLIAAMRILAADIQSSDGVANLAIAEAADRLEELQSALQGLYYHTSPLESDIIVSLRAMAVAAKLLTKEKP